MPDTPNQSPVKDLKKKVSNISNEKKWALSCYIPLFNIVFCILASIRMINSKFVLYHARQGLIFFALWIATLLIAIISSSLSLMLLGVLFLLHVAGIISAFQKKTTKIPLISTYVDKIPEDYIFIKMTGKIPERDLAEPASNPPASNPPASNPPASNKK